MCVAYTALLNDQLVVLKTPLPDTSHAEVAANDLEVRFSSSLSSCSLMLFLPAFIAKLLLRRWWWC